jgi:hypothetical protein
MRTLVLVGVFGLGCVFLLPRTARSVDDCVACYCKQCKAWQTVTFKVDPRGMRMPDPMNKEKTIPVLHVPDLGGYGNLLAATDSLGTPKGAGVSYKLYGYNKTPDLDCKVDANENGNSLVRVNYANAADWDDYYDFASNPVEQRLCEVTPPPPPPPGGG